MPRKIVWMMSVSLDGYMSGPNGELDWHLVDEEVHRHFNELAASMGADLTGRVTFEMMADYWPTADEDPDASEPEVEFARIWRDMPKYVYSRTLETADWNATIVRDVVVDEVLALKAEPGGDLGVGGANLAASFMELGLIDEFRVYVHPVIIGRGKPMFTPSDSWVDLDLIETRTFTNGVVLLRYGRAMAKP